MYDLTENLHSISLAVNNENVPIKERQDIFMRNFAELMKIDIAAGQASSDTIRTYMAQIRIFFDWLRDHLHKKPLDVTENDLKLYRHYLYSDLSYKQQTVSLKLSVLRRFYQVAVRNGILQENPCLNVYPGRDRTAEDSMAARSLTLNQLNIALHEMGKLKKTEENMRNTAIFCLMVLQGWRTVEVYRASVEDVDFDKSVILVHGKTRDRLNNPREDTMKLLVDYLNMRAIAIPDERGTPLFTSLSNNKRGERLTRYGIRMNIDNWLSSLAYKIPGFSCHGLRHTFGTLLYAETLDLRLVAEEMGHANVNQTAKYAHIVDRSMRRLANAIPVKIDEPTSPTEGRAKLDLDE